MKIAKTTTITRSAPEVWAVLADFGAIARWAPNVDHACLMSDQVEGVGMVRRIQTGRNTVVETVVEWVPAERLSYSIGGLPPVVQSVTNTWDLAERFGVTTVTLTSEIEAGPRPPQQVAARGVARTLGKASEQMLTGLNAYLTAVPA